MALYTKVTSSPSVTYVRQVWPVGDSITTGVNGEPVPGWRYTVWHSFGNGALMNFVGSQSYAGVDSSLAADPFHEGHNGQTISQLTAGSIIGGMEIYQPDVFLFNAGINDIIVDGVDASTVLSRMSNALTEGWNRRRKSFMRIAVGTLLKNLTPAVDTVVQAVNAGMSAMVSALSFSSRVTIIPIYNSIVDQTVGGGYADATHPNATGYGASNMGTAMYTGLVTPVTEAQPN